MIRQSWYQRWRRGVAGGEAAEFERLTRERLYGERRAVQRLVERPGRTAEEAEEPGEDALPSA